MARGLLKYPFPLGLLYPAAFLSGATALAYEIVWTRRLSLVLGSTTAAAAAVLSAFMFGLALGAVVVGWRADESKRPLRWYGILELGIGCYALAFDTLLDMVAGGSPWLVSFVLLALPAALMGGTLPVLARSGADTIRRGTGAFGSLFGVNTLGAVAGALLTVFVLLEPLGLAGTVKLAAGINIALGVLFWLGGMGAGLREIYAGEEEAPRPGLFGDAEPGILIAFFLAGFAGLALEMAWMRLLVYFLEGFTIAFGLMLATYLLGLGAGALGGTFAALASSNPRRLLARILLVQAVLALGTFLFATPIGDGLEAMRVGYAEAATLDFGYAQGLFWAAAAIIFPATFCGGMLTPVVARIALSDREWIGCHTGVVYAVTTLGAVVAPPVAGFFLLPALGVPGTIAAMAGLVLLAGTVLALDRGMKEWVFAGGAAVVFVAICLSSGLSTPLVKRSHVFREARAPRRLLAFEHGERGDVSVVEELQDGSRRLYVDGFSAAETSPHYGYMRMLGHLPVLLHPDPESVCVIAFGTGTTAGAVSVHPEVKRIVCVEIEPAVYEVASHFERQNRGVLDLDRAEAVVADGREFVRRSDKYDVITLEPLMPYTPAAVYLYTSEFYADARASLDKGGLLCQWIPPQGVSNADLKRLVASVASAFEHVSLWYFKHAVLVLGADSAPQVFKTFIERAVRDEVLDDLRRAVVGDPAHLLGAHVCSGDALAKALEGVDAMVDDRTDLEFRPLPRRMGKRSFEYHAQNLEFLAEVHQEEVGWLDDPIPNVKLALRTNGVVLATLAKEMRNRVEGGPVVPASALARVLAQDKLARFARSVHDRRRYTELMGAGRPHEAAKLALAPDRSLAFLTLAERAEGDARRYYLTLAVRQNAFIDPRIAAKDADTRREARQRARALLAEFAESGLAEPARRFCLNRARALAGEPLVEGDEALPEVPLPDVRGALAAGDVEAAREALERAAQADLGGVVDEQVWEWFQDAEDPGAAVAVLDAIGSTATMRAALKVARRGTAEDLVALAPIFCRRYPTSRKWEQLCRHALSQVREAAAEAAKAHGTRAHLPALAKLCADRDDGVRLSAFISFRDIEPAADKVGYDPRDPATKAVEALVRLADEAQDERVRAAAGGK